MSRGYIVYEGPSELDQKPIVMIATLNSKNEKTGAMIQTWIMRSDIHPLDAAKNGEDASICGDCSHRPIDNNTCYVNLAYAPNNIWKTYKRGRYQPLPANLRFKQSLRLGSYGDPAAVPRTCLTDLSSRAPRTTGYTHQWRTHDLQTLCMASVDTPSERAFARARGYRTFRIRHPDEPLGHRESACPASRENDITDCATCGACCGTERNLRGDIAIIIHGTAGKTKRYDQLRTIYNPVQPHA